MGCPRRCGINLGLHHGLGVLLDAGDHVVDVVHRSKDDLSPVVKSDRNNVKDRDLTVRGKTAGSLLRSEKVHLKFACIASPLSLSHSLSPYYMAP